MWSRGGHAVLVSPLTADSVVVPPLTADSGHVVVAPVPPANGTRRTSARTPAMAGHLNPKVVPPPEI
ncbi:hypothetical protein T484DRAFT_1961320 [Baffinella frigidus]|nr:hypothetical protein T484DRAFT_1961320 [Cryptophyta sp. CCMP2293]